MAERPSFSAIRNILAEHFKKEPGVGPKVINDYSGDWANYSSDIEFDVPRIETALYRVGYQGMFSILPLTPRGSPVKELPYFTLDLFTADKGHAVLRMNGRRIVQELVEKGIENPEKMQASFISEFDNNLRKGMVRFSEDLGFGARIKARFLLGITHPNLVRKKVNDR